MNKTKPHNDIVKTKKENNDNDIDIVRQYGHGVRRANRVDRIADHLVQKFKAPNSRNFFCKCAWKMSEDEIWTTYEQAHGPKVNNSLKYFIALCQIKMNR